MTQSAVFLDQKLRKIYDHLYANASAKTPQAIASEVLKILRVAQFIENKKNDTRPAFNFTNSEYKKLQKGDKELVSFFARSVHNTFQKMKEELNIYAKNISIELTDYDLAYVCSCLSGVFVSDPQRDVLGDATEIFRSIWAKTHGGQFFTDQRVTRLAMVLLRFNPCKGDDLVDICSGTGGFLLAGLNHLKTLIEQEKRKNKTKTAKEIAVKSLFGQEIDQEVCAVANSSLKSRLGNNIPPIVQVGNSVLPDKFVESSKGRIRYNSHSCLATNPPFGTKITVKDPDVLQHYEISRISPKSSQLDLISVGKLSPRSLDILFLEQNIKLLKPGSGRLAIVIPYQIASGPQTRFVREWLLRQVSLIAIIDLPGETFQPYTGTKTCLLVVKRRKTPLEKVDTRKDDPIFMATPKWIGHDRRGNPVYQQTPEGKTTDEILEDFSKVSEAFNAFLSGANPADTFDESFSLEPSEIMTNPSLRIDARFHRPNRHPNWKKKDHSQWSFIKLKGVVKRIYYPGRFKRNYVENSNEAVPFLGGTNISQLILKTDKWLSPIDPKLDDLRVQTGWILITRSGSTGIVSTVPQAWDGYAISEHVIRIVPDAKKMSPEYLYAFLKSDYTQEILAKGVYGSVIDEITPEFIGEIEVLLPDNPQKIEKITAMIRKGEKARQQAIENLELGVDYFEQLLTL